MKELKAISNLTAAEMEMPPWALRRTSGKNIRGISYFGKMSKISNIELDRPIHVLGYNHNIQSSYGVTTDVRSSIGKWLIGKIKE